MLTHSANISVNIGGIFTFRRVPITPEDMPAAAPIQRPCSGVYYLESGDAERRPSFLRRSGAVSTG
jgi:hypothetical protein